MSKVNHPEGQASVILQDRWTREYYYKKVCFSDTKQKQMIWSNASKQLFVVVICIIKVLFCLLSPKELLSERDVENLLQVTGCSAELQRPSCPTDCLSERYRSIAGECNNRSVWAGLSWISFFHCFLVTVCLLCCVLIRQHPRWGAANVPYSRWLPPEYEDVWGTPRGWDPEHTYHNVSLPPVRAHGHPLFCQLQ